MTQTNLGKHQVCSEKSLSAQGTGPKPACTFNGHSHIKTIIISGEQELIKTYSKTKRISLKGSPNEKALTPVKTKMTYLSRRQILLCMGNIYNTYRLV